MMYFHGLHLTGQNPSDISVAVSSPYTDVLDPFYFPGLCFIIDVLVSWFVDEVYWGIFLDTQFLYLLAQCPLVLHCLIPF